MRCQSTIADHDRAKAERTKNASRKWLNSDVADEQRCEHQAGPHPVVAHTELKHQRQDEGRGVQDDARSRSKSDEIAAAQLAVDEGLTTIGNGYVLTS